MNLLRKFFAWLCQGNVCFKAATPITSDASDDESMHEMDARIAVANIGNAMDEADELVSPDGLNHKSRHEIEATTDPTAAQVDDVDHSVNVQFPTVRYT